jgi:hypothetical protein
MIASEEEKLSRMGIAPAADRLIASSSRRSRLMQTAARVVNGLCSREEDRAYGRKERLFSLPGFAVAVAV